MCQALRELMADKLEEGMALGRSEGLELGRSEGLALGRSEGLELGRDHERFLIICNMLRLGMKDADIQAIVGCEQEFINSVRVGIIS